MSAIAARESVLLLDDEAPTALVSALEDAGHFLERATEVAGARTILADAPIVCVVASLETLGDDPRGDCQELHEADPSVPIVVYGEAATLDPALAASGHVDAYLHLERFDVEDVLEAVETLGQRYRPDRLQRLQRESEMLSSLLENIPLSIYFKDRLSRHERVSDFMTKNDPEEYIKNEEGKIHVAPEDVLGKTDYDLYAPSFAEETIAQDNEVMESETPLLNELEEGTASNGERQWTTTTKAPRYDEDGNVIGLVGVTLDVTEREEHRRQLEYQNQRLNDFAEVLTHDLRNPLNVARGYARQLQGATDGPNAELAGKCDAALERMDELIDDVRKFILEGRRVEEPEAVDLGDSASQAWETVDTLDAELVVETSATVRADPARLQRVFENLFRNAIEHGRSDVTITVRSGPDRFSVADDGPGIPADDRETVFERGYTSSEDGTGFGLAIVENIAAAHDWTVAVDESEAGGASFVFSGVIFESGKIGKTLH